MVGLQLDTKGAVGSKVGGGEAVAVVVKQWKQCRGTEALPGVKREGAAVRFKKLKEYLHRLCAHLGKKEQKRWARGLQRG